MEDEHTAGQGQSAAEDLVVIDRGTLRQTMTAVVDTLQSAVTLEKLQEQEGIDPEIHQELKDQLNHARQSMIEGISMMLESLESLPSVKLTTDDAPE